MSIPAKRGEGRGMEVVAVVTGPLQDWTGGCDEARARMGAVKEESEER